MATANYCMGCGRWTPPDDRGRWYLTPNHFTLCFTAAWHVVKLNRPVKHALLLCSAFCAAGIQYPNLQTKSLQ